MTRKMTERIFATTFFALLILFFTSATLALAGPKWKDEVGIAAWCYNLDIMKALIKADIEGDQEAAFALFHKAIKARDCVQLPVPMAAFKPANVIQQFKADGDFDITLIRGNIIKKDNTVGREAFVLVNTHDIPKWQVDSEAKFPTSEPQYSGWQNL